MGTPGELDQTELVRHPGYLLARARWRAFHNFEKHVGGVLDLRPVEFSILVLVSSNRDVSQAQLAQALGVAAPNMTTLIHKLETRGLLERERADSDRRKQFIALTPAGRRLLAKVNTVGKEMNKDWLARLTAAEQAMLMELLHRLAV